MAQTWAPKAPTEIVERRWTVPVDDDDGLSTFARSASGVTIDSYSVQGDDAVLTLSAGVADVSATVTLTATTSRGRVLVETFYLPILATANDFAYTGQDICDFALRKVIGNGQSAEASELDDALERLSDMLARWKGQGANLGVVLPVVSSTVLYVSDAFASAIKNNLILEIVDLYPQYELSPRVEENARRGLQQIKSTLLSKKREALVYY
jgi:hypothetical protein